MAYEEKEEGGGGDARVRGRGTADRPALTGQRSVRRGSGAAVKPGRGAGARRQLAAEQPVVVTRT
jgi:hypothetical protein